MNPTITCPHCSREHALFWKVPVQVRWILTYLCDHAPVIRKSGKKLGETYLARKTFMVGLRGLPETKPYENINLPEQWTKKRAKKNQRDLQPELPI
jgi:hypothetical protein